MAIAVRLVVCMFFALTTYQFLSAVCRAPGDPVADATAADLYGAACYYKPGPNQVTYCCGNPMPEYAPVSGTTENVTWVECNTDPLCTLRNYPFYGNCSFPARPN